MNKKIISRLTCAVLLTFPMMANAELIFKEVEMKPVQSQPVQMKQLEASKIVNSGSVTQVGSPSLEKYMNKGFAKDIDVVIALEQIVPAGWHAKKQGILDVSKKVSWVGEKYWIENLESIAKQSDINIVVDWNTKYLTVSSVNDVLSTNKVSIISNKDVVASEVKPAVLAKKWTLDTNKTLKNNLEDWAKIAGYTVEWEAVNYRIPKEITFTGEFDSEEGPIKQISELYSEANQPLSFDLREVNKVLYVTNGKVYKQQSVNDDIPDSAEAANN